MFGSLRLRRHGLSVEDRRLYHAQFCGGCHALREFGGRPLSLLTNYDQAFLFLVYSALESVDNPRPVELKPCTGLPLRRVSVQSLSERGRRVVAALTVALVRAKLQDDVHDEGGSLRRAAFRALGPSGERALLSLGAQGFPVDAIESLLERQAAAEMHDSPTFESLSEPTSSVLRKAFGWIAVSTGQHSLGPALRKLGEAVGRFVYVWDAVEDQEKDAKGRSFNALAAVLGPNGSHGAARQFLGDQLNQMSYSIDRLPLGERESLARHLVASLSAKVAQKLPVQTTRLERRMRVAEAERGFCDAGCACDGCACDSCACDTCACDSLACHSCGCETCHCGDATCCHWGCCDCLSGCDCPVDNCFCDDECCSFRRKRRPRGLP